MPTKQSIYRGCLLGLAVGDAMGYTVDSRNLEEICRDYGPNGLLGYDLVNGYADVTSYTQIAGFTGCGLLMGLTRGQMQGRMAPLVRYVALAIKEWSRSQQYGPLDRNYCWLSSTSELKRRHCMDTRMLDMLNREPLGTPEEPTNRYTQPGALTEAVAVALLSPHKYIEQAELDRLGAEAVALTHGDPEAFLSAAVLTHALSLVLEGQSDVREIFKQTRDAIQLQFGREYPKTTHIWELLLHAATLAKSENITQMAAMEQLQCRTCGEVLAGAMYACMTCHGDFDAAMITAVNHSGRSAAVGAVTGALLGAWMGEEALPEFYMECLEPTELLRELADDMAQGCSMDRSSRLFDGDWDRKYLHGGR